MYWRGFGGWWPQAHAGSSPYLGNQAPASQPTVASTAQVWATTTPHCYASPTARPTSALRACFQSDRHQGCPQNAHSTRQLFPCESDNFAKLSDSGTGYRLFGSPVSRQFALPSSASQRLPVPQYSARGSGSNASKRTVDRWICAT